MKKATIILVVLIVLPFILFAQNVKSEETQTTISNNKEKAGGYGGFEFKGSQILDNFGLYFGARGGWIIDNTFSIGGALYYLTTSHKNFDAIDNDLKKYDFYTRVGYGGLFFEYMNSSHENIHFIANSLIGLGWVGNTRTYNDGINGCDGCAKWMTGSSMMFVFEPAVGAEFNLTKSFKMDLTVGYRIVSGLDVPLNNTINALNKGKDISGPGNSDISGFSINLMFKFASY